MVIEMTKKKKKKKRVRKIGFYDEKKRYEWSDTSIATSCPHAKDVIVVIPEPILEKIKKLIKAFSTEWLGYLPFEKEENEDEIIFRCTDLLIPEQEVTYADVDVKDSSLGVGKGAIHCHPWKHGTSHSKTDEDYVDVNHPFSIVVSKDLEFSVKAVVDLPCGSRMLVEGEVEVEHPSNPELDKWLKQIKSKIKEKKYTLPYRGGSYTLPNPYYSGPYDWQSIYGRLGE